MVEVIILLAVLLAGFAWGRRKGRQEGVKEGMALGPLALREQSLINNRCCLCGWQPDTTDCNLKAVGE